ncbi:glycosyltransferase [Pedobacter sp. HMF7647]|uniref:Glycosyltransferase n=1 Tax=Hufsiella arboris TaxID=2695275 RepID=A0A7K1YAU2_9SPHI|nr:glycosyltransferase family 2 protein [Hufsiella arboris]MXV51705.1 glycosyltransferase [Hufsiella arboris]
MASVLKDPLLTISIPTYNRSLFLNRSLEYIEREIGFKEYPIELIISDNCSTDNTYEIIEKYVKRGLTIRYLRNNENKGPDYNIAQCYAEANGKYVLTLGDDDVLYEGAISRILEILGSENEYGVVFIQSSAFKEGVVIDRVNKMVFDNSIGFVEKINIYSSFISSNIVNKKFVDLNELHTYLNTCLIQTSLIFKAILNSKTNMYVETVLVGSQPDNTGGYDLFKVFGENFNNILDRLSYHKAGDHRVVKKIINDKLLADFFPHHIISMKRNQSKFSSTMPIQDLRKIYVNYIYYWILILPLIKLPYFFSKVYLKIFQKVSNLFLIR